MLALLAGLLGVLTACGQTRVIVVSDPGFAAPTTIASNPQTAGAAPVADSSPTSAGDATGGPRPATDDELAAIDEVIQLALGQDATRPFDDRREFLVGADDLGPTYEAVFDLIAAFDVEVDLIDATTDGATATATVDIVVDGTPFLAAVPVLLERVDGEWKVTRDGACAVLAAGSPCPDQPAAG